MRKISLKLFLVALTLSLHCRISQAQDVLIIANKNSAASQISAAELRDVFTGVRTRLSDGTRAIPVALKGGPAHEVFLKNYLQQNPDEFRVCWRKVVFTGKGSMIKDFSNEAAMLDYVSSTPGAIGYVTHVADVNSVKVLTVTH
jgi:ABC-type phosphate transport system substrate-binding protein